jgi:hypothetical protein
MLPKLQQSSLAQSLRRDNLASQIQCTQDITKAKINSEALSGNKTTTATNHGRTTTHPRTHIRPSETSPNNTSPKRKSRKSPTNPSMNLPFPAPSPRILAITATEARPPAPSRRKVSSKNLYPNQGLSRRGKSLLLSSGDTTTEETSLSESTTRTPSPS